jgi:hypothetical protein
MDQPFAFSQAASDARATPPSAIGVAIAKPAWLATLHASVQQWWRQLWMDEMTVYLSQATSHVDLEHRIRAWNDFDRKGLPPLR